MYIFHKYNGHRYLKTKSMAIYKNSNNSNTVAEYVALICVTLHYFAFSSDYPYISMLMINEIFDLSKISINKIRCHLV